MNLEEITRFTLSRGFQHDHAKRIATNFYRRRMGNFMEMKDIPLILRRELTAAFSTGLYKPVSETISEDISCKYLFRPDMPGEHEAVFIPEKKRNTICVSVQSGCGMGCHFCATGRMGLIRDLTAGEIINQVYSIPESATITHVVFMGMGEPLDNPDEVLKACGILTAQWGFAISPARITVSTVGILDKMKSFLEKSGSNLTLSLFSPFPGERLRMIPAEKSNPSGDAIAMMKEYSSQGKRRFSVAYMMMKGINDSDDHLRELIRMLKGSYIRVNLLPYHRTSTLLPETASTGRMEYFKHELVKSGISASVRRSRGNDISAACGLLSAGHIASHN